MTWSCWVKPTDGAASGVIFSRRDGQRVFRVGLDAGRPFVEVQDGGEPQRVTGPAPLPGLSWHHLAVVAADGLTLVVDGAPAGMVAARLPALDTASTLGGDPGAPEEPARPRGVLKGRSPAAAVPAATPAGFKGEFDELQIAKVDRPAGFLMLAAVSQGTEPGKLVAAGQDEQGSSAGGGYFAVILRSVTLDGWVIIGILGVMSLLSVVVMVGKAGYLSAVERANDKFTERFRAHAGDLPELVAARPEKSPLGEEKVLRQSSLFRLFQIAASQIRARSDGHQALHAEAIESIRASMDAGLVRENQRLAKQMVLLTIAISGGPFLGLLGTVMGVMITFAAIAAAGDVNVNAIAPGIAAALVATVAGLAVAIPALFGYNWLLTRNKDVTANMVVFADEMVTKVAEEYSERAVSERVTRSAIHLAPPASAS
jgi:biopolymer transport protein ExbB